MTEWEQRGRACSAAGWATIWAARCGSAPIPACSSPGSLVAPVYGGAEAISERHRHRYEVNINYRPVLEQAGLRFSGMSPDGRLPEMVELPGPSLVRRRAVPPRAEVAAVRAASPVRRLHPGGRRAVEAGMMTEHAPSVVGEVAIANRLPLALIAGPCAIESREHALMMAGELQAAHRPARHPADLQELVRQGQPHQRLQRARPRARAGHRRSWPR